MDGFEEFIKTFYLNYDRFGRLDYANTCRNKELDSDHIDASLLAVHSTFHDCKIPVEEDSSKTDPKCVTAFKLLLLNSDFKCLNGLSNDPKNGSFVSMNHKKLSPYFLMEIVLYLKYEQILAESLLHISLDLGLEILEPVEQNIFLWDFERGLDLVIAIILNCHKNLILACKAGIQSRNLEKNLEILMIKVQKFMAYLSSPKFLRLNEVVNLQKSERIGSILKKTIALTYKCLSGNDNEALSPEIAVNYRLMFRDEPIQRSEENVDPKLRMLNQEFLHILLRKLEAIDVECYDNWADLASNGHTSVSLQSSIRKDLYDFMEFLQVYRNFIYYERLMELLQKFNPQPLNIVSTLNLDGLRYGSRKMKIKSIKSVIRRYSEWDHDTFDLIRRNRILLGTKDIPYLIDYLELIMRKPGQEYHKRRVFVTIRRALLQLRDFIDWEMETIEAPDEELFDCQEGETDSLKSELIDCQEGETESLKSELIDCQEEETESLKSELIDCQEEETDSWESEFDDSYDFEEPETLECLDPAYSTENFKSFIARNEDLKSPINLRTTLSYLLNNPRDVLQILIEVIIGVPDYAHLSIPPEDLIFFYPVVILGGREMRFLLLEMRTVIMRSDKWDAKKFVDLVNLMLKEFKFTANDFVKHVFAYWLDKKPTDLSAFVLILKFVRDRVTRKCTTGLHAFQLVVAFAERLSDIRRDLLLPRSVSTEVLSEIRRTAKPFIKEFGDNIWSDFSEDLLEPIDRFTKPFSLLSSEWFYEETVGSILVRNLKSEVLRGFEMTRESLGIGMGVNPDAPIHFGDLEHLKNDLVRYPLIKLSETEIVQFAGELAEYDLDHFYDDHTKLEVIDTTTRRFIETAIYFLEFPDLNPPESFACLMRALARFIGNLVRIMVQDLNMYYTVSGFRKNIQQLRKMFGCYRLVKNNLSALAETVRHSSFHTLYESLMATVDDSLLHRQPRGVALCKIQSALEKFGNDCLGIAHNEVRFNRAPSAKALRIKRGHDFIHKCLNIGNMFIEDEREFNLLCATLKLLRTQE